MARPTRPLSDAERLDWLRLARTEQVGPVTFRGLLQRFGSAGAALHALPELSRKVGRARALVPPPAAEAEAELAALERLGARLVAQAEPDYPELLAATDDGPPVLALAGRGDVLSRPCVALVGARNASGNGRRIAERLARELTEAGLTIVSGLARGIDAAAHKGALDGGTAAVLAGGIDVPFPPENEALHARIAEDGVLLAESPPGTRPTARHFPRRNRIISGLSLATVVVEAAPRSGSLITARLAAEQGREVFGVPGSPLDPRARGCNDLIRGGAVLVQSAAEVLEGLAPLLGSPGTVRRPALAEAPESTDPVPVEIGPAAHVQVVECLSPTPTAVDEVLRDCQLSPATVFGVLLELELAGRIERHPGNRVALVRP
ncbi:MAG: DNA-protecting protein DprA [Inquilinus sp.]|nr:DNA-protecting protein DprA [Inquilinus sp.]